MTIGAKSSIIMQKNQAKKLVFIDIKDSIKKQQYVKQYTYRAYIILV